MDENLVDIMKATCTDTEDLKMVITKRDLKTYDLNEIVDECTEYWDTKEAAEWLGVKEKTISKYVHEKRLKPSHRGQYNKCYFASHDVISLGWELQSETKHFSPDERLRYIAEYLVSTAKGRNALYDVISEL